VLCAENKLVFALDEEFAKTYPENQSLCKMKFVTLAAFAFLKQSMIK